MLLIKHTNQQKKYNNKKKTNKGYTYKLINKYYIKINITHKYI